MVSDDSNGSGESNSKGLLDILENSLLDCSWIKIPALEAFFAHLQEDEQQMIALFDFIKDPSNPPADPAEGSIEFGFILYWIHNPPSELTDLLADHRLLQEVFHCFQQMAPPTKITTCEYDAVLAAIGDGGVGWTDGTMIGLGKYEQLDYRWVISAINYAVNLAFPHLVEDFRTGSQPHLPAAIAINPDSTSTAKTLSLGIVGDWGTGKYYETNGEVCPAIRVLGDMTSTAAPAMDRVIHLGDAYYAGTGALRAPANEEGENFTDLWPQEWASKSYTLNSNHEMYGAAEGYYKTALDQSGKFGLQDKLSYFAMTYGKWLILGLDSAYYSDQGNATPEKPHHFYMEGAIGSPAYTKQIDWVSQFKGHDGPIMVMTHHTACDLTGANTNLLYTQVTDALGIAPSVWYWGHLHNGIAYNKLNTANRQRISITKGRCCGHGSIPFGHAWGLENSSGQPIGNVDYFANTPDPKAPNGDPSNGARTRVKNGYAVVELRADGGYTESFYEVDNSAAVWSATWSENQIIHG